MFAVSGAVLTTQDRQEELSRVYVGAVAAGAGYTTSEPNYDRDSVDLMIHSREGMRPSLALQLKATINLICTEGVYRFPLKISNYNQLREANQMPRLLVVLDMPRDETKWLTITNEELILRRLAYWISLKDCEEIDNTTSTTVLIPKDNVFDVDSLRLLMDRSSRGSI